MLSHEITKKHGSQRACPRARCTVKLARLARGSPSARSRASGVTLEVTGDANDYVGKGLSAAAKSSCRPPADVDVRRRRSSIIIGNVALYGATAGKAFFRGVAAERFLRPQLGRAAPSSRASATTAAST